MPDNDTFNLRDTLDQFVHEFTADDFVISNPLLASYHPDTGARGKTVIEQDAYGVDIIKIKLEAPGWDEVTKRVIGNLNFYLGFTGDQEEYDDHNTPILKKAFLLAKGEDSNNFIIDQYLLETYRVDTVPNSDILLGSITWRLINFPKQSAQYSKDSLVTTKWSWPRPR